MTVSFSALALSQAPLKRGRAELHTDTKNKTEGAEIQRLSGFQPCMADTIFEFGASLNTQNSTVALDPRVGKYQSIDPAESQVFQNHSASTSAL